jgi:hypothetical protein
LGSLLVQLFLPVCRLVYFLRVLSEFLEAFLGANLGSILALGVWSLAELLVDLDEIILPRQLNWQYIWQDN